jgi:UDP-glucose 4-epimerase
MRLVLVGQNSFVARHVLDAAKRAGLDAVGVPHNASLVNAFDGADAVVNFAMNPDYMRSPWREEIDCDLLAARAAANSGARFGMLSSRRVYGAGERWGARETAPASGDETQYGKNKAATEAAIAKLYGANSTILRLSNVFGEEWKGAPGRRSFFALLSRSLKRDGVIRFDMDGRTKRDFIPAEDCARAIVKAVKNGPPGTYNLGSGVPLECGVLANWVLEGYGSGRLSIDHPVIKDEFYLDIGKWRELFGAPTEAESLEAYCRELGKKLRCEKF